MINDIQQFEEYHEIVVKFMRDLFRNRNRQKNRLVHCHTIVSSENSVVGEVFTHIEAALVQMKLRTVGIWELSLEQNTPNVGSSALKAPSATTSVVKNNNDPVILPQQNNNA